MSNLAVCCSIIKQKKKGSTTTALLFVVVAITPKYYNQQNHFLNAPFLCGASEKPYPGMEGHTTSNTRSSGSDGSVSRGINP